MYLEFYGLREQPFGVTPDPRYLYFSSTHREALASLFYGIETDRGFLTLIAPPGMGKTTLLFHLLERLRGAAHTAFLFQTQCDSRELFQYLLTDLGIAVGNQNLASMHEQLNAKLLSVARAGKRFVLVIDEAQNLEDTVLETVRLLSDLETTQSKLMQIVLSGQPQLADKLSGPGLAQFRQRISIVSRLEPFTPAEVMVYIDHRLRIAGYTGDSLFTFDALAMISAESGGIPRNINNLCFNSLSLGYARRQQKIDSRIVKEVLSDLSLDLLGSQLTATRHMVPGSPPALAGVTWNGDAARDRLQAAARAVRETGPAVASDATTTKSSIPRAPRTPDGNSGARSSDARPVPVKPDTPMTQATLSAQEQDLVFVEGPGSAAASPDSTVTSAFSVQSQETNNANHTNPPAVSTKSQESSGPAGSPDSWALRHGSGGVSVAHEDLRSLSPTHGRADQHEESIRAVRQIPRGVENSQESSVTPRPVDPGRKNTKTEFPALADSDVRRSPATSHPTDRQQRKDAVGSRLPPGSIPTGGIEANRPSRRRPDSDGLGWARRMLKARPGDHSRLPVASLRSTTRRRLGGITLRRVSLTSGIILLIAFAINLQVRHSTTTRATTEVASPQTTVPTPGTVDMTRNTDRPGAARRSKGEEAAPSGVAFPESLLIVVQPDQTLSGISVRQVGSYDPKLAEQIQELNPDIKNPDHIEVGQRIRLPRPLRDTKGADPADRAPNSESH